MAKAEKKVTVAKKEIVAAPVDGGKAVVSSFQAKDLSQEKRIELYTADYEAFKKEKADQYGLMLDVELAFTPKGIVPRQVLIDLVKQQNEQGEGKAN